MKVILTETIAGLGEAGAIKEVADGYARNFLLPKRLAVAATRGSMKQAESQAELYARKADKARTETQKAANAVEGKTVVIHARVGSENRLYGSVTPADIAEALASQHGLNIDRRKIELAEAIHRTGTYSANADFGNGVSAKFNVEVLPEGATENVGAGATATATEANKSQEPAATTEETAPAEASVAGASDVNSSADSDIPEAEAAVPGETPTGGEERPEAMEAEAEANPS